MANVVHPIFYFSMPQTGYDRLSRDLVYGNLISRLFMVRNIKCFSVFLNDDDFINYVMSVPVLIFVKFSY